MNRFAKTMSLAIAAAVFGIGSAQAVPMNSPGVAAALDVASKTSVDNVRWKRGYWSPRRDRGYRLGRQHNRWGVRRGWTNNWYGYRRDRDYGRRW